MNRNSIKTMLRKLSKTAVIAMLAIFITGVANAQGKMKIAVLDFNPGVGTDVSMVNGLSDMLINSLFETRKFTIVERNQLYQVIKEQGFQQSVLSAEQIAKVGKILGVQSVLVGTVNFIATDRTTEQVSTGMISGEYNLDVRIVDVESGEVVSTAGVTKTTSKTYRDLMPDLANQLSNKLIDSNNKGEDVRVITLHGYLRVYPEDLGDFEEYPSVIISRINNNKNYGISSWRLPTAEEFKILMSNSDKIGLGAPWSQGGYNGFGYWYLDGRYAEKSGPWRSQRIRLVSTE